MASLPRVSVQKPIMTAMVTCAVVLLGLIALTRLPMELYSSSGRGIISLINRVRGGLAPSDVEALLTRPLEDSVASVAHLKSLYSNTREGESRLTLEFDPGADMDFAALEVREKFFQVEGKLPPERERPVIANYSETDAAVLVLSVTSETKTPEEIRSVVDQKIKPRMMRVPGVASVDVYGGRERKILVELDRDKLFSYGVSIEKVMQVLNVSNVNLMAGNVERGDTELLLRTLGAFQSIEEIGEVGIGLSAQGSVLPLKEVGTVKDAYLEPEDYARLNLDQNVTLQVKKVSTGNTIRVVDRVKGTLDKFLAATAEDLKIIPISDRADVIRKAIKDVRDALYLGIVLTAVILLAFLRSVRLAAIVIVSIPVSVLATFIFMDMFHVSLNIMTLSGLSLAIGMLVDSSIVVLENTVQKREAGLEARDSAIVGAEEVNLALTASLATNICVFLPILFIDKEIRLIYEGLAFTVVVSQVISLAIALTLVPMVASKFKTLALRGAKETARRSQAGDERGFDRTWAGRGYRALLRLTFPWRAIVLALSVAAFCASAFGLSNKDMDLPRTLQENEFSIVIFPIPGAELGANDTVTKKVEEFLLSFPEVETVSSTIRRDDLHIFVRLKPKKNRVKSKEEIMVAVREKGNELVKSVHDDYSLIVDEGVAEDDSSKIVINIFGETNEMLEQLAHEVAQRISGVPGLTNLVMTDLRKKPEYKVIVDRGRAAFYGLTVRDVADSLHAQIRGMRPTLFHEKKEGLEIEVITRMQPVYRQKVEDLKKLLIETRSGSQIQVEQIASFYPTFGPTIIDRKDKHRYVFVKGDITKGAMETVAKKIRSQLVEMKFPKDYYWRFGGGFEKLQESRVQLAVAVAVTCFLIYMVLACMFQSYTEPLLIMVSVPLAAIGVWLALTAFRKPLSQPVFIGMIVLAGIVVNSAIIFIDHLHAVRVHTSDLKDALVRTGLDRLRPILMTSLSTILGFAPLAAGWGEAGELWAPLALTVMGGMAVSTILTLFVLPNLYLVLEDVSRGLIRLKSLILQVLGIRAGAV